MKLELDFTPLGKEFDKMEQQSVTVGILDTSTKAAKADYDKPITSFSTLSGSTPRRYVKLKGRNKNITLRYLAKILDKQRGIISEALNHASNKELVEMAQLFAKFNKTPRDLNRLRGIAISILRNPILDKQWGSNTKSTIEGFKDDKGRVIFEGKGFNHYGFSTGTFFKNIKAVYKKR